MSDISRAEIDGLIQSYISVSPQYVICGDTLNVDCERGVITWDFHDSMVIVGFRLDGWPIESLEDEYQSVAFDSVSRPGELR